ncbi:MAG: amidohydrolase [Lachnospiraceae bacterium]|nr:amidohydrolase [Lachnospiraceae bacterium]
METMIIKNINIINENAEVSENMDVFVENGVIAKIAVSSRGHYTGTVIDGTGLFLTPGIPNLHVHTAMNIFKGIAEDCTSDQWFNEKIFPFESKMTPEDVYLGTRLGIAEMINNGVTVFADHYFMEDEVLKAVKDSGARADLAPTLFGMAPDFKKRLSETIDFIETHRNDSDRVAFHSGPHANYTCPPDTMREIADASKAHDLPVHIHISEEESQVELCRKNYGKTPFEYLYDSGVFEGKVLLAHGLWIEPDDLKFINDDTFFAFCPKTYMKLGSGRGGMFDLYSKVNFCFGTDGAASSNTLNPIEQARLFALLCKYQDLDGRKCDAASVWKMLMKGHRAFPFNTGKISEGSPADLVIWDLHTPDTLPVYDPVTSILYSSNSSNVKYTIISGEILKSDGKLCDKVAIDPDVIEDAKKDLLKRGKGEAKVSYPGA